MKLGQTFFAEVQVEALIVTYFFNSKKLTLHVQVSNSWLQYIDFKNYYLSH